MGLISLIDPAATLERLILTLKFGNRAFSVSGLENGTVQLQFVNAHLLSSLSQN